MNVFVIVAIAMLAILIALRLRKPIGVAMLAGSLCVWVLREPSVTVLLKSLHDVATMSRTYELIFALYFVMCLEMQLRLSGAFQGTMNALRNWFRSNRISIAFMPAILGLLPSLGGEIFSAPMVDSLGNKLKLNAEQKAVINFWYRHCAEYCSPIQPGLLVASVILAVPMGAMIAEIWILSFVVIAVGWWLCIPSKAVDIIEGTAGIQEFRTDLKNVLFTMTPVLFNFIFVVLFSGDPAISMGVVVMLMFPALALDGRPVSFIKTLRGAFDWKLILNVSCIIFFIQILTNTDTLENIVAALESTTLSIKVIVAAVSFLIGLLTGISQGHAAMIMPLVATLSPHDAALGAWAFVFGVAGQMITPTHLCLVVTVDYFKADFFKTLRPIVIMQALVLAFYVLWQYVC